MAEQKTEGGRLLLEKSDFVKVVDTEGNDLPPVPKHWTAADLPAGAKKKSGNSSSSTASSSSSSSSQSGPTEPAGNASREDWATYAVDVKGATPEDLVVDGKELTRDELKAKYGTPSGS